MGDSYFDQIQNLYLCMFPSCVVLHTVFRTVFVFAPGPFRPMSYSYRDPNCSDSPLEYDNSRLSLDENCHILEENYTNLVSFFSNSRVRITHSLSTTTRITFL